ncbi:Uncharacterised protein [Cedecea neteri]|uniref:Uncharacterized protein n=1 Tax=Cedecea neteri TaxID=158822 RepID=A0A2X3IIG8_9ENTR|nr:Uncharacterised protein [Cedecea neteri]
MSTLSEHVLFHSHLSASGPGTSWLHVETSVSSLFTGEGVADFSPHPNASRTTLLSTATGRTQAAVTEESCELRALSAGRIIPVGLSGVFKSFLKYSIALAVILLFCRCIRSFRLYFWEQFQEYSTTTQSRCNMAAASGSAVHIRGLPLFIHFWPQHCCHPRQHKQNETAYIRLEATQYQL